MVQKKRSFSGIKIFFFLIILPIILGAGIGGYIALAKGVPSVKELKEYRNTPSTKIYADDDTLLGEIKAEKGIYVPLKRMPPHLINAVIAIEDSSFWKHKGIDYFAILRAAAKDLLHMEFKQGGSTITQQLAKMTFLTPEKTIQRKLREIALAQKIEKSLSKEEILEIYLNRAYFGHGAYGVEMASKRYFGKSVSSLTLPESALLAGLLKAPTLYSPINNMKRAKQRQTLVLERMQEEGFISPKEATDAINTDVSISNRQTEEEAVNYFLDYIEKYLESKYGVDAVYKGGLKVFTTLDRNAQIYAQRALREGLRAIDKRRGWRGPIDNKEITESPEPQIVSEQKGIKSLVKGLIGKKELPTTEASFKGVLKEGDIVQGIVLSVKSTEASVRVKGIVGRLPLSGAQWVNQSQKSKKEFSLTSILKRGDVIWVGVKSLKPQVELTLEQEPEIQGAIVAIEPRTGFIKAMVGGYDYTKSEFNRAVYAYRQAGSAFKPIIYSFALENGYTPSTKVLDEPVSYKWKGGSWEPKNYDGKYWGEMTLREALAYSRNAVTVSLVDKIGVERVINFARSLGIQSNLPENLSLALGSLSVSPLELTSAYSAFANGGQRVSPISIKYITDSNGRVLESNSPMTEPVISAESAFLITTMLEDVINYGTGTAVKALGRPAAGKTGTTNDYKDAWFVGYTPELLAGVWVGYDDMKPLGNKETGGRAAAPIWLRFMSAVLSGKDITDFEPPEGIQKEDYHIENTTLPYTEGVD